MVCTPASVKMCTPTGQTPFSIPQGSVREPTHCSLAIRVLVRFYGSSFREPPVSNTLAYPSRPSALIWAIAYLTAALRSVVSEMFIAPPVTNSETNHRSSWVLGFRWTTIAVPLSSPSKNRNKRDKCRFCKTQNLNLSLQRHHGHGHS